MRAGCSIAAALLIIRTGTRRNLANSDCELVGTALMLFNLLALALIVVGRADRLRAMPFEVAAPRYFFHTTLFWTGLLLLLIKRAGPTQWTRWPLYGLILLLPVLLFPAHRKHGINSRWARHQSNVAAIALINGVRDDQVIKILFHNPEQVYQVAPQLRSRRLDMFARGLQDWIGRHQPEVTAGRHDHRRFNGRCRVATLLRCDDGAAAARVVGQLWERGGKVPRTAIILDPTGTVCGIGYSSHVSTFANKVFYANRFRFNLGFVGYIRSYDPQLQYTVRSADDGVLSDESVVIGPLSK